MSTQPNFLFSCSEDVKLSSQGQSFCQFEADVNNRKCGLYQLFHLLNDPCLKWKTSDVNETFRGYTTMTELCNPLNFITMLFFIQKILRFSLGVACLKSVSILQCHFDCFGY